MVLHVHFANDVDKLICIGHNIEHDSHWRVRQGSGATLWK